MYLHCSRQDSFSIKKPFSSARRWRLLCTFSLRWLRWWLHHIILTLLKMVGIEIFKKAKRYLIKQSYLNYTASKTWHLFLVISGTTSPRSKSFTQWCCCSFHLFTCRVTVWSGSSAIFWLWGRISSSSHSWGWSNTSGSSCLWHQPPSSGWRQVVKEKGSDCLKDCQHWKIHFSLFNYLAPHVLTCFSMLYLENKQCNLSL